MSADSIGDSDQLARITALVTEQVLKALEQQRIDQLDRPSAVSTAEEAPQRPTHNVGKVSVTQAAHRKKKITEDSSDDSGSSSDSSSSDDDSSNSESSSSSSASSSASLDLREKKHKKRHKKSSRKQTSGYFTDFKDILSVAEESDFFIPPRGMRILAKPEVFVPPTEARQSAAQFTSPLVKFLFESIFSVGFHAQVAFSASTAALQGGADPVRVAKFIKKAWQAIHNIAADAALMADLQTDPSVPKATAKAALLMRATATHTAAVTPLAKQINKLQRKAGEAAMRAAAKEAHKQAKPSSRPQQNQQQQQQHKPQQKRHFKSRHTPHGATGAGKEPAPANAD